MSATQIVPIREKAATVRSMVEQYKSQITIGLQGQIKPEVFLNAIFGSLQKTPALLDCTPRSLINAVLELSQLGLLPGVLQQAYLIPFKNAKTGRVEAQLIIGYKGLIKLCRNSGEISTVSSDVVYSNETFECRRGTAPKLEHIPMLDLGADRGKLKAAYAVAQLKDGSTQFEVMPKAEIDKIRARSRAKDSGPWVSDYEEMARKTVLRRLCKVLPSSEKLQKAVALDELAAAGVSQDFDVVEIPNEPGQNAANDAPPPIAPMPRQPSKLDQVVANARKPKKADDEPSYQDLGGGYAEGADPDPESQNPGSDLPF